MEVILHIPKDLEYEDRISLLASHSIGLWDVVSRCIRPGSSDAAIRESEPTRIGDLLIRSPDIRTILCNGRKAEEGLPAALQNYSGHGPAPQVRIRYLPSSSPAHAIKFQEKCRSWMIISDLLKDKP